MSTFNTQVLVMLTLSQKSTLFQELTQVDFLIKSRRGLDSKKSFAQCKTIFGLLVLHSFEGGGGGRPNRL